MTDLRIQGGEALDPGQGLRGCFDIAVAQGRISEISLRLEAQEAGRVVDVSGTLVVPSLIDLHAHVYARVRTVGVNENCLMPAARRSGGRGPSSRW
jgi:dihydroorotase